MPFGNALSGWHLVIILLVILLLFGAPKLPGLAKSLGQSMRIFRKEVRTMKDENASGTTTDDEVDAADDVAQDEPAPAPKRQSTTPRSTTRQPKS